jgi:hypothetical protein
MQNAFSPSVRVLKVLTVPVLVKSPNPTSPLRLMANSAVNPYKIQKTRYIFLRYNGTGKSLPFPKGGIGK